MVNIVIPAAGRGQRFKDAGYNRLKPLIRVGDETMLAKVIKNLNPTDSPFKITVILGEGVRIGDIGMNYKQTRNISWIRINETTKGAACTVLAARELIDTDTPLMIASCDQLIDWKVDDFLTAAQGLDGSLVTYRSDKPYHSFCKVENGLVTQVAEKEVISDNANIGVYYFGKGSDFVTYAERMLDEEDAFNGEFYLSKVYNHLIQDGKRKVEIYEIQPEQAHILGTPVEFRKYLTEKGLR